MGQFIFGDVQAKVIIIRIIYGFFPLETFSIRCGCGCEQVGRQADMSRQSLLGTRIGPRLPAGRSSHEARRKKKHRSASHSKVAAAAEEPEAPPPTASLN